MSVSGGGVGRQWPAAGFGSLRVAVHAWDLLRRSTLSSLPPPQFGLRSNNREGTQPHPLTENWVKDTELGPAHQNKTQFLPQSVSPIRNLVKTRITEN